MFVISKIITKIIKIIFMFFYFKIKHVLFSLIFYKTVSHNTKYNVKYISHIL